MADLIASSLGPVVEQGARVTLHFSLLLPGGEEIDSTRNGKPATFIVGDGSLLPGFEAAITGKQAGYAEQISLPAALAFGEKNKANVRLMKRSRFLDMTGDQALEVGLVVSFDGPDGGVPGVVAAVYEDTVKIDFNHPLSGSDITFDVSILKVDAPGD